MENDLQFSALEKETLEQLLDRLKATEYELRIEEQRLYFEHKKASDRRMAIDEAVRQLQPAVSLVVGTKTDPLPSCEFDQA